MRQVIVSAFVSLDGVMQAPGGPDEDPTGGFRFGGWTAAFADDVVGEVIRNTFSGRPYELLLGRKTYEIFAAYWPYYEGAEDHFIAKGFNKTKKYVATSSNAPLSWNNSVAIHHPIDDVARLKREDGPDLLIQGSSVLIHTLLANGLIDRITLLVYPVMLGRGKRLFSDTAKPTALKLESSKTGPSGIMANTYTPAGPAKTGSLGIDNPSPVELARRERWKREG
jgi:dihydrofolate reductase